MTQNLKINHINKSYKRNQQTQTFKAAPSALFSTLDKSLKPLDSFIRMQENLSGTRFVQDTATNWVPKAVFARSKADLAEMSFLEFGESALFYFAPGLIGEHISRKIFSKFAPKNLQKQLNSHIPDRLSCAAIPAAEYALSFAKNLFTLKVFKKSDFNNIANLNKNQKEDTAQQQRVEKSAKSHIKKAAIVSAASLGAGVLFAAAGHRSKAIQSISKGILQPGAQISKIQSISKGILQPGAQISKGLEKIGIKSKKLDSFLRKYINFDFDSNNGKLALSHGQLAATVMAGVVGYNQAAKDRGRLDQLEVMTRLPLVAFYTIFGSSLFEHGFKNILHKKNVFPDLIKKTSDNSLITPTREELPELAKQLAKKNKTNVEDEFAKLIKGKATITAVPFLFSLVFMGFTLAGISRLWTQYRYNKQQKENSAPQDTITITKLRNPLEEKAALTFASFK